jgi:hypothetical protein
MDEHLGIGDGIKSADKRDHMSTPLSLQKPQVLDSAFVPRITETSESRRCNFRVKVLEKGNAATNGLHSCKE